MKHGPIALIDEDMPVVVVVPRDTHYEKTLSNMQEVRAREGRSSPSRTRGRRRASMRRSAAVTSSCDPRGRCRADVLPLLTVLPLQLLAYYVADLKGTDVDQPRNLAKTVTVE